MINLSTQNIAKAFAGSDLFSNISFTTYSGDRLAIIGQNGCGKSTLLKILANELTADSGTVVFPNTARIGYVAQELSTEHLCMTLFEYVMEVFPSWQQFWVSWKEAVKKNDLKQIEILALKQAELEDLYGYNPEYKAQEILSGLGFATETLQKQLNSLSGGWQERSKLARVLVAGSDILFLDEPTNHLDLEAVAWLENYLLAYKGILIFVAHDRYFLDKISTHTISLSQNNPEIVKGNFSKFIQLQSEQAILAQKKTEKLQSEIAHKQKFVDRFGSKATKATQAQSRVKQIEQLNQKLTNVDKTQSNKILLFKWPEPERSNQVVLTAEAVSFAFPDKTLFSNLSFEIIRGKRIGLVGANGQGKSTLLKLITRELNPSSGKITIGSNIKIGYSSQQQSDIINLEQSVFNELCRLSPNSNDEEIKSVLGLFLLGYPYFDRLIKNLSGGEKSRLLLATLFCSKSNFLVLDEPTNHLDMETREALVRALALYKGTILVVAHDRYFLNQIVKETWEMTNEGITIYDHGFDQYYQNKFSKATTIKNTNTQIKKNDKERKKNDAQKRNEIYAKLKPLKENLEKKEILLTNLIKKQEHFLKDIANPEIYEDKIKTAQITKELHICEKNINETIKLIEVIEHEISIITK